MLIRTFYLDVKDAVRTFNRFEVRFALDGEAIQHSKELAANFRLRKYYQRGLIITVLDQANRKIHEEFVYPEDEERI
jgi:hypothetical protein